jgi:hypothetical protein
MTQQFKGQNTPAFEKRAFDFPDDHDGDYSSDNGLDALSDGSVMRNEKDSDVSSIHSLEGQRRK